ncbi:uncharacterized protein LOC119103231 [Pollicipes pollicipes]|uniref:uncharacterized protein LOC119103231 n=1 Tax=Pollicipes pollicipes TaxID=41117 RepID=UPI001884CFF8|nr:uncharacterized protein LOC119103231 [Pollicipes pollicipes]
MADSAARSSPLLPTMELEDDPASPQDNRASPALQAISGLPTAVNSCTKIPTDKQTDAEKVVCHWNDAFAAVAMDMTMSEWEFGLSANASNEADLTASTLAFLAARNNSRGELLAINITEWVPEQPSDDDKSLQGQMFILSEPDAGAAQEDTTQQLLKSTTELLKKYVETSICPFKGSCKEEDKLTIWDLQKKMAVVDTGENELSYYWNEYRRMSKDDLADTFTDYVKHGREAAEAAGTVLTVDSSVRTDRSTTACCRPASTTRLRSLVSCGGLCTVLFSGLV